jgi:outer membrane autotransporter protein
MGGSASTSTSLSGRLGQTGGGGRAASVTVTGAPVLSTSGLHAAGLVAQSVTNGGGLALAAGRAGQVFDGTLNLGASAGGWNFSGPISVQLSGGSLKTSGDMAPALVAQAIGGGGGLGLMLASNVQLGGVPGSPAYPSEAQRGSPAVTVTNSAPISTTGAGSVGIVAQSVGNGGGLAYASSHATLGGSGGGGHGGKVLVNSNASINTSGVNAFGILAQSVGGGGGAVLSTGQNLGVTLNTDRADAGDVTVNINANITTSGAGAHGVVAQSVRGGGGIVTSGTTTTGYGNPNSSSGTSGLVKVIIGSGVNISVSGAGANAVWAWSSTDPVLEISPGATLLGGSGAAAIRFDGPVNEVQNDGRIGTVDGHTGLAVHTTGGEIAINNRGLMLGNLQLAAGANNRVHNQVGSQMLHGGALDLGGSGTLRNDGTLAHGGAVGAGTRIDGHFEQGAEGQLMLRLDHAKGTMDTLTVSGSARLQGELRPQLVNAHQVAPGSRMLGPVITAGQGVDVSALSLTDTAILDFELHPQAGHIAFSATADFSPEGMNEDVQHLGDLLGTAQGDDRENFRTLTAQLVALRTPQELHQAYWELSGAGATSVATVGARLGTVFGRLLVDRVGASPAPLPAGQAGHNAWAQALGETHAARSGGAAGTADLDARLDGVAVGTDTRLDARTTLGLGFSGANTQLQMSHGYRATGQAWQLGVYGSHEFADGGAGQSGHYAAGALTYARHELNTERLFELTGAQYRARLQGYSASARAELGYRVAQPRLSVAPYAGLQVQHFVMQPHRESASSQPHLALNYGRSAHTQLRTELGAALDGIYTLPAGEVLRLRGRLAWAHENWTEHRMNAAFQTLQSQSFSVTGVQPVSDLAVLALLAELQLSSRMTVELNLQGEFGRRTQTRTGAVALRYRW